MRDPKKVEALNPDCLAAEGKEGFGSGALASRLARYGKAKANALQFRQYLEQQAENSEQKATKQHFYKLADSLGSCGNYAVFRDYYTIGQTRLSKFCTCKKHLICPLCAIRRGAKSLRVYLAKVDALMKQKTSLRPYLVTLTVKNGDSLDERFTHLYRSLRAYHKQRRECFAGNRSPVEANKAISAVWSYEFTNKGKGWHPHVHAIWLCSTPPDPYKLSEEWHSITGDSMIVDARPILPDEDGSFVSGFVEVFKYAVKFSSLADADRLHAFHTLRGKRLQDSFGDLRGLDVEPSDSDELLEDLPYIERLYVYQDGSYRPREMTHVQPGEIEYTEYEKMILRLVDMGWSDDRITAYLRDYETRLQEAA
jgi:plasmid rolling circle replication initiator protein Rep